MIKVRRFLAIFLCLFCLSLLGACTPEEEVDPPVAPTELTINIDVYDGTEKEPYVLVGNTMILSAIVNDEADPSVTWELASTNRATLEVEEDYAYITGVAGGNIQVTCKSAIDENISDTIEIEVCPSSNYKQVVMDTIAELEAKLPEYATADFALPQPENPNVKVEWRESNAKKWTDNKFHYTYEFGDVNFPFYGKVSFHGALVDYQFKVKVVQDVNVNDFTAISKAEQEVSSKFTGLLYDAEAEEPVVLTKKTKGMKLDLATNRYLYALPESAFGADLCGLEVTVKYANSEKDTKVENYDLVTVVYNEETKKYSLSVDFENMLTAVTFNLEVLFTGNSMMSKYNYIFKFEGWSAEEIYQYLSDKKIVPKEGGTMKASLQVDVFDSYTDKSTPSPKFGYKVKIEYESLTPETVRYEYMQLTPTTYTSRLVKVAAGNAQVKVTVYYGYRLNNVEKAQTYTLKAEEFETKAAAEAEARRLAGIEFGEEDTSKFVVEVTATTVGEGESAYAAYSVKVKLAISSNVSYEWKYEKVVNLIVK